MNSKNLVDGELATVVPYLPTFNLSNETLPQVRAKLNEGRQRQPAARSSDILIEERSIPGAKGAPDVRVVLYSPAKSQGLKPGYVYMHGGGYVMGSADMFERQSSAIVGEIGCTVVSVDYRLAPEAPHPGPVEDCYAALAWLHANAEALGVDRTRIAVGGESAGGGLAAALSLLARDRGKLAICFQLLGGPMIDDRTVVTSDPHRFTGEFVWNAADNRFAWRSLLGRDPGGAEVSSYAAAARAENLADLPPAFIGVGSLDLFLEENIEYARRLLRAGVPAELHVYPGGFHGFEAIVESAAIAKQYRHDSLDALKRALGKQS